MNSTTERVNTGKKVILQAGNYLKQYFLKIRNSDQKVKTDGSILLTVDSGSEQLILDILAKNFPNDSILTEESLPKQSSETVWIIDPLCGSYSFLRGMETWSVSIALVVDGIYEAGFVYQPLLDILFSGVRGEGVLRNRQPVFPSQNSLLGQSFVSIEHAAISDPKIDFMKLVKSIKRIRVGHGSGMELGYVASGCLDAVIKTGQTAEHYSGGRALIEIAGGVFVGLEGKKLPVITDQKTKIDYIAAGNHEIAGLLAIVIKQK